MLRFISGLKMFSLIYVIQRIFFFDSHSQDMCGVWRSEFLIRILTFFVYLFHFKFHSFC